MRHGTVVSVDGTASGLLFAAHRPAAEVEAVLKAEGAGRTLADLAPQLDRVRAQGWSGAVDGSVRGVSAVAAPVFDGFGQMVLALTAIGPSATLEVRGEADVVRVLRERGRGVSGRLGGRG
jgi:DNA-binding IclR family transcriptional regulator